MSEGSIPQDTNGSNHQGIVVNDDLDKIAKDFEKDQNQAYKDQLEKPQMVDECKSILREIKKRYPELKKQENLPQPSYCPKISAKKLRALHTKLTKIAKEKDLTGETRKIVETEVKKKQSREVKKQLDSGIAPENVKIQTSLGQATEKAVAQGMYNNTLAITYLSEKLGQSYLRNASMDDDFNLEGWTKKVAEQENMIKQEWIRAYRDCPEYLEQLSNPYTNIAFTVLGAGIVAIAENDTKKNGVVHSLS